MQRKFNLNYNDNIENNNIKFNDELKFCTEIKEYLVQPIYNFQAIFNVLKANLFWAHCLNFSIQAYSTGFYPITIIL